MPNINITVSGRRASRSGDGVIVGSNTDYTAHFDFDAEWDGVDPKTARFVWRSGGEIRAQDVVFRGSFAQVPPMDGTDRVRIGVFAGNLRTTTAASVPVLRSIREYTGAPPDPAPDVYDQIMELLMQGGGGGGGTIILGHALEYDERGRVSVKVADTAEPDNTLPITSGAVHTIVGNIDTLLDTI